MNRPDSTGESLESILASIRRSLAEQSTGILDDEPAAPATLLPPETGAADDTDVPRLFGGIGAAPSDVLAGGHELLARLEDDPPPPSSTLIPSPGQEESPPSAQAAAAAAPARLEDPPPPASATVTATSPAAQVPNDASRDPLWFMKGWGETDKAEKTNGTAPAASPDAPLRPAVASAKPAAEPRSARTEIVRGPLPPFFGSSAEAAKVEVAPPVPSVSPRAGMMPSAAIEPPAGASGGDPPRGILAPRALAWPPAPPGPPIPPTPSEPPAAREGGLNGKASSFAAPPAGSTPGPAPADAAETPAHVRGLEAMVAELLRPMLRRWLDENMPRLVSAALKAEADLISERDPKKP